MTRPPLSAFDDEQFAAVSDEHDIGVNVLRALAKSHQEGIRELPGVDDIVYEWRNQFHQDPLVYRTDAVYVLALQSHVWTEFATSLDISDGELAALRTLHDRQARSLINDPNRFETDNAIVLTRP
jgi:hypothetical protein